MVNSTVEVRPHGVHFAGQDKTTIAPSAVVEQKSRPLSYLKSRASVEAQGGYSFSNALLAKGQQQVTTIQVAYQALHQVGQELQSIKRVLVQNLNGSLPVSQSTNEQLNDRHNTIKSLIENAKTDNGRVLDAQLNVQINREATRTFTIPGLNLSRMRHQSEQLRLEFPQTGSIVVNFDAKSTDKQLVNQMDRQMIPLGLRAEQSSEGDLLFRAKDSDYNKLQQQVYVTGQGHRYPAGQPNVIKLKPEPEGVEDLEINTGKRDGIRHTLSKVNQHIRQVQQGLDEVKAYQVELTKQLAYVKAKSGVDNINAAENKLVSMTSKLNVGFSATYQAISAQANVHRHTVVALLK